MWWNDEVKSAVSRKDEAWKKVLGARDEDAKERCLEVYKEKKRKVKRWIYYSKKEFQEQFGRKINKDVNEKGKSILKGGK